MSAKTDPKDNVDRLLSHLRDDSLAAQLVRAYRSRQPGGPEAFIKTVLMERLAQERAKLNGATD
jgi:hypothetical protein